ncbi:MULTISPECIES: ABC transporter permease [unclassified Chelatococcus]|uniref:ABC transporter permease n=1 Tax=unclassified Chelatococcus TaxID=2638111 RepID=UPI001BCC6697|nr:MULTISPECIES: ABC transporter permease [unclassified Chelatococcus]MBS7697445.1 ABC transporter permease [Chelatococcus sp. YT9]MBX3559244.1 ABC transporter permease [Chelatococcus sp.]
MQPRSQLENLALIVPATVLLVAGFALPIAQVLLLSIRNAGGELSSEQFVRFLTDPFYLSIAWRTIRVSALTTICCVLIGFPLAYLMSRASAGIRFWLTISVMLPLMTGVVVRTYGWIILLGRGGVIPDLLWSAGLTGRNFTIIHTETAIVVGMVQVLLPFMTLSILGVMLKLDKKLEEAARTLGAGFFKCIATVVMPLSIPGVIAGSLLVFALSASSFITPALLGGVRLPVVATSIFESATKTFEWQFAAAQSVILLAGVLLLLVPTLYLGRRNARG